MLLYEFLLLVKVETHLAVAQQNHFSVISPTLKIFTYSEIKSTLGKTHKKSCGISLFSLLGKAVLFYMEAGCLMGPTC